MKKITLLLSTLALAACDAGSGSSDGYKFETKEYFKPKVFITFKPMKDRAELMTTFAEVNGTISENRELMAFSVINPDSNNCTVYYIAPEVDYQPEWIGHEAVHCVYGRFHSNP